MKENGISDPLLVEIVKLGDVNQIALSMAIDAYVARDEEKAKKVILTATEEISQRSRFDSLVLSRAQDSIDVDSNIVPIPSVMKVANLLFGSLEMAIKISKRASLAGDLEFPDSNNVNHSIKRMAREIGITLNDSVDAIVTQNYKKAEELCEKSTDINQMYNALFREFLTHMMEDPRNITPAIHAHYIVRNLEQISQSFTSISEETAFIGSPEGLEYRRKLAGDLGTTRMPRDQFDMLRDLDTLLQELMRTLRAINDPDRVNSEVLYVRAAAESLSNFLNAFSENQEVEVPKQVPLSLMEKLRSPSLTKLDGVAALAQRIADIISKLF